MESNSTTKTVKVNQVSESNTTWSTIKFIIFLVVSAIILAVLIWLTYKARVRNYAT